MGAARIVMPEKIYQLVCDLSPGEVDDSDLVFQTVAGRKVTHLGTKLGESFGKKFAVSVVELTLVLQCITYIAIHVTLLSLVCLLLQITPMHPPKPKGNCHESGQELQRCARTAGGKIHDALRRCCQVELPTPGHNQAGCGSLLHARSTPRHKQTIVQSLPRKEGSSPLQKPT